MHFTTLAKAFEILPVAYGNLIADIIVISYKLYETSFPRYEVYYLT